MDFLAIKQQQGLLTKPKPGNGGCCISETGDVLSPPLPPTDDVSPPTDDVLPLTNDVLPLTDDNVLRPNSTSTTNADCDEKSAPTNIPQNSNYNHKYPYHLPSSVSLPNLEKNDNLHISKNNFDKKFLNDYTLISKIKTGSSGFVLCATPKHNNLISIHGKPIHRDRYSLVAVKIIYKNRIPYHNWVIDKNLGLVPSELSILYRLDHPNIALLLNFYEDKTFFYLVLEHGSINSFPPISGSFPHHKNLFGNSSPASFTQPNTTLFQHLSPPATPIIRPSSSSLSGSLLLLPDSVKHVVDLHDYLFLHLSISSPFLTDSDVALIFYQIVSAVKYLHDNSIVHSDIKVENVTIDVSTKRAKLIDFGSAICLNRPDNVTLIDTFTGTLSHAAPEISNPSSTLGPTRRPLFDSWSLGVLLFFISFNSFPFRNPRDKYISDVWFEIIASSPAKRPPGLISLISELLQINPTSRIDLTTTASNPWLLNALPSSLAPSSPAPTNIAPVTVSPPVPSSSSPPMSPNTTTTTSTNATNSVTAAATSPQEPFSVSAI